MDMEENVEVGKRRKLVSTMLAHSEGATSGEG